MKNFENILSKKPLKLKSFTMDDFQEAIYNNLHLEFLLENARVTLKPDFKFITTGKADSQELEKLKSLISSNYEKIVELKKHIILNLVLYSSLLESNSYYIALNNHFTLIRFIAIPNELDTYVVKVYTFNENELESHYDDKMYIGRDVISINTLGKDHFGIKFLRDSLQDETKKLNQKIKDTIPKNDADVILIDYVDEIEEILNNFIQECNFIIKAYPSGISTKKLDQAVFIEINMLFRDLKHNLIEIDGIIEELEKRMFEKKLSNPVKYVTKFKKDITNYINYITFKVNTRISDMINHITIE